MVLIHVDGGRCGPNDQKLGCDKLLIDIGYPCEPGCQSYLFSHNASTFIDWKNNH
jgi:hypothetical protein